MDAQSLPVYQHEPLCAPDAVRVLVLKPAKVFEDPLRCDIIQYSRSQFLCNPDNTTHYATVSYTWGEPIFSEFILCDRDSSIMHITPNVKSLLQHLRKKHVSRYLWIDAICLNQGDTAEKAAQIPLMGKIYEAAKKLRIWLGNANEDTAKVFAFLRSTYGVYAGGDYAKDPELVDHVLELLQKVFGYTHVDKIEKFLRRPWFSRRWVIQEAMSALHTTVHCGNNSMPFRWFTTAFNVLRAVANVRDERLRLSDKAIEVLEIVNILSDPDISVMELLWKCHDSECRDPQDRVLAFYGLLSSEDARQVPFDYNSHWTDFFRRCAFGYAQEGGGYALLHHIIAFGSLDGNDLGLSSRIPSWVPDWTRHRQHTKFLGGLDRNLFFEVGNYRRWGASVHTVHYNWSPHLQVSKAPDLDSQALELEFYSFSKVQQPIAQVSYNCNSREVSRSLSTFFSLPHSNDDEGRTKRFIFLISEMLHLSMGTKLKVDYILKYSSKSERDRFSGKVYDVAIGTLFHHILDIWKNLAVEDYPWSPEQIYLLNAVGNLLQTFSLFYLSCPVDSFGLGPRSLQKGDLVVPLNLGQSGSSDLFEGQIVNNRTAVALRLDDANGFDLSQKKIPKGRILGACFCCFKMPQGD